MSCKHKLYWETQRNAGIQSTGGGMECPYCKITRLTAENKVMRELLNEVAVAGVPFDDPRIDYVEIQVDRDTLDEIRDLLGGE